MSGSILGDILAAKRVRVAKGEFSAAPTARGLAGAPDGARFAAALSSSSPSKQIPPLPLPLILAEIKHRSPSAGLILSDADARIESVARAYRRGSAAALSVVIEQDFFGGDPSWLPRAKAASGLPVLMKDFVVDEAQLDFAVALGADAVLLIVAALESRSVKRLHAAAARRGLAVVVEAHDGPEIELALESGAEIIGVNARNLSTFVVDLAAMADLGRRLPASVVRLAESGIRTRRDVDSLAAVGYGAFLVGESLLRADDPARALRGLRGVNATEVKICGLTREEDVDTCMGLGVDWIGLVFASRSPRKLTKERGFALKERAGLAKGVVAVFADNGDEAIEEILEYVRPQVVQMPNPALSIQRKFSNLSFWNTFRVGHDDLAGLNRREGSALHLDTSVDGHSGGTGKTFDWSLLADVERSRPLILAGGLNPANVAEAIKAVHPDVVDVASGVESWTGIKDGSKIAAFVAEVRNA